MRIFLALLSLFHLSTTLAGGGESGGDGGGGGPKVSQLEAWGILNTVQEEFPVYDSKWFPTVISNQNNTIILDYTKPVKIQKDYSDLKIYFNPTPVQTKPIELLDTTQIDFGSFVKRELKVEVILPNTSGVQWMPAENLSDAYRAQDFQKQDINQLILDLLRD